MRWVLCALLGVSDAVLHMTDSANASPWDEEHSLSSVDFGPMGYWDLNERSLSTEALPSTQAPDVSTVFSCSGHIDVPVMTYALRVYDPDGIFADCATWGDDPAGYIGGAYSSGFNPVSNPAELASCIDWN